MKKQISAIIIDVGGVLYHPDTSPRKKWVERLGISERELAEIVFNNAVTNKAKIGDATPDEIWQEVQNVLNLLPYEVDQLKVDMWKGHWDIDLLNLLRQYKGKYKLATMSDAWPDARENIKEYVNYDLFDVILFSAEEGLTKPASRFYEMAAMKMDVSPKECIFIDDNIDNVRGAVAIGMKGIQYVDGDQIKKEM